eukprot:TRINITY_DN8307_c0_g1_i1.p1 TRINITY_DN8307_c0_g1~~TRINITY_DN8307_c0_g1_i1.p1  ORF type:complete len:201 (-),score=31.89 TRINITY_DN8307_c0_g1_i1:288-866(-)
MEHEEMLMKFVLIGDAGAGKKTMIKRFVNSGLGGKEFDDRSEKTLQVDDLKVKLILVDPAGQELFRSVTSSLFRGSSGILILFDVTDAASFKSVPTWLKEAKQYATVASFVLVATKIDRQEHRKVSKEVAEEFAREHQMGYMEVSSTVGTNVDETFHSLVRHAKHMVLKLRSTSSVSVSAANIPSRKRSCMI